MKRTFTVLALGAAMVAGMAIAEAVATDPIVIAQKDLMHTFGGAAKALGGMAGGKEAFDAAAAATAKAALVDGAAKIAATFATAGNDPASKAKPEIWTNAADFAAKAQGLADAAAALDVATLEGVQAGMAGVGGACKACHSTYRAE